MTFTEIIDDIAANSGLTSWVRRHRAAGNLRKCRTCPSERWADKACTNCGDAPEVKTVTLLEDSR